jgi:hypothetical protein
MYGSFYYGIQRLGIAEGGIFCVPSADTEADLFSFAEDNICCPIEFRHPDNWS